MRNAPLVPFLFMFGYLNHLVTLGAERVNLIENVRKLVKKTKSTGRNAVEQSRFAFFSGLVGISKVRLPPAPAHHLLLSNDAPTEHEISVILVALHQAAAVADALEDQLGREPAWKELTLFKHQKATKFISDHRAIISSVRRLPPEILQEIFLHVVASDPNPTTFYPWHKIGVLPYGISQVSSLWRKTALNSPHLWTRIPMIPIESKFTSKPRYLASLAEVLSRTCGAPLELHLYGPNYMLFDGPHPAVEMLIAHSMSWKTVTIEVPSLELPIFDAIKGRLPLLETLIIRGWYFISPDSDIPIDTFQDAPRLRDVRLFHTRSKPFTLPFSQLVHYHQEEGHAEQLNDLLISTQLSALKCLVLYMNVENRIPTTTALITLTSLTVLKLRVHFLHTHHILLGQISLPVLEELLVDSFVHHTRSYPIASITSLITRAGESCPLQKLYLRSFIANHGELTALLVQFPLITHLALDLPTVDDLRSFVHSSNQILPRLQNCSFFAEKPLDDDRIDLCRMFVDNRCERTRSESSYSDGQLSCDLRALYIHYSKYGTAEQQQKRFQQWSDTETSLGLNTMRRSIMLCFPELASFSKRVTKGKKLTAKLRSQVLSTLTLIRDVEIDDIDDVYASGLHQTLYRMNVNFEGYSGFKGYLSQSAKGILDKWESMFNESISDFRWKLLFTNSLLYIPKYNSIRSSPDLGKRIIFGEVSDEILPLSDQCWPWHNDH